tara:strand:+ start:1160 stop:3025 length:1866 start_codon:yes stop_codon:yes gene_type:complete
MECAMSSIKLLGNVFLILVLGSILSLNSVLYAVADSSSAGTQNNSIIDSVESSLVLTDNNASVGSGTAPVDAENIKGFQMNNENGDIPAPGVFISGYVTTTDGKAILVDGRPVLQEKMEDGTPRFTIPEDGNGVLGLCDGLGGVCVPSNLNKFTYSEPDEVPLVLMTYNQHIYDTEGIGTDSSVSTGNNTQVDQITTMPDLTQNDPGTTTPSTREECASAAQSGSPLPSLSSGCIQAANEHLDEAIPEYCASDFMGPTLPSQTKACADNSQVKNSADSHEFIFANQDNKESKAKTDDKDSEKSNEENTDPAESDAEEVGREAEEALEKIENDTESKAKEAPQESFQEDSANQDLDVDESKGAPIEALNGEGGEESSSSKSASSTPQDIKIMYGDDENISSDEDDSMSDNITNEEPRNGGFIDNNSDWFTDDGDMVDPDDFENKVADDEELSEMDRILGLEDAAEKARKSKSLEKPEEEQQEGASPSTGDVSINSGSSSKKDKMDVESLKINLNAADEDIDAVKMGLSVVDEKTGVKIIQSKDGFMAETFSLKTNSDSQTGDNKQKLISSMNEEELMNRFNLSEDELEEKLSRCNNLKPKPSPADCLKEDASLFGELLIRQD